MHFPASNFHKNTKNRASTWLYMPTIPAFLFYQI